MPAVKGSAAGFERDQVYSLFLPRRKALVSVSSAKAKLLIADITDCALFPSCSAPFSLHVIAHRGLLSLQEGHLWAWRPLALTPTPHPLPLPAFSAPLPLGPAGTAARVLGLGLMLQGSTLTIFLRVLQL